MQISLKQIAAINRVSFSNAVDAESKFPKKNPLKLPATSN